MTIANALPEISDTDLLGRVSEAVSRERKATAELIALLAEVDRRELYLAQGCSSLYTYCTEVLHLGESAALRRIKAARAARDFPIIVERLRSGALNLTNVTLLKPHLTAENHVALLDAASHKSRYNVEKLVATLSPRSDETESYRLQLTISLETYGKLRRVQDLLRHRIPTGDFAAIFDRAITLLLQETLKTKAAMTRCPRATVAATPRGRSIPAAVRRAVWRRDDGRCAFKGAQGRCGETSFVEYHHVIPFAAGGATSVANIELRCRAHNAYEAREFFGPRARERKSKRSRAAPAGRRGERRRADAR